MAWLDFRFVQNWSRNTIFQGERILEICFDQLNEFSIFLKANGTKLVPEVIMSRWKKLIQCAFRRSHFTEYCLDALLIKSATDFKIKRKSTFKWRVEKHIVIIFRMLFYFTRLKKKVPADSKPFRTRQLAESRFQKVWNPCKWTFLIIFQHSRKLIKPFYRKSLEK